MSPIVGPGLSDPAQAEVPILTIADERPYGASSTKSRSWRQATLFWGILPQTPMAVSLVMGMGTASALALV